MSDDYDGPRIAAGWGPTKRRPAKAPIRAGFGDHHTSPEHDLAALRYELDGCREKIAELRAELDQAHWELSQAAIVYDHVTGGRLSKTGYEAAVVTTEADQRINEWVAEGIDEEIAIRIEDGRLSPGVPGGGEGR